MGRGGRYLATTALLALFLTQCAIAAQAQHTLELSGAGPVSIEGLLEATGDGASAIVGGDRASFEASLHAQTGQLIIWTAEYLVVGTEERVLVPQGDVQREAYPVTGSILEFSAHDEPARLALAQLQGGRISATANASVTGLPRPLALAFVEHHGGEVPEWEQPSIRWPQGSAFVGQDAAVAPSGGFPLSGPALIRATGAVQLKAFGGTVAFVTEEGERVEVLLGAQRSGEIVASGSRETWRRATFEGVLSTGAVSTGEGWGMAAPMLEWTVEGATVWTNATGRVTQGSYTRTFTDARLSIDGSYALVPQIGVLQGPVAFEGAGNFSRVQINGDLVQPPAYVPKSTSPVVAASFGLLLANALWLAPRVLASMYSRIHPGSLLEHATRRKIYDIVVEEPGLHVRGLSRRVGGAWGPFSFHLTLLANAGYVRVETRGRYRLIFPTAAPRDAPSAPAIPNPVAQAVFERLPKHGARVAFAELKEASGISRQLLSYHLRTLERAGFVQVHREAGRIRGAARTVQESAAPAALQMQPRAAEQGS